MKNRYTDDNYLHMFFHHYLHHMYDNFIQNAWGDGFDEKLDPDYLAPFMYDLADRLGYKLEDNMWIET